MTLRERLLALLREANYSPSTEPELLRQLGLHKNRRASLAHEVRQLLAKGQAQRVRGDRIALREAEAPAETSSQKPGGRKIFSPTKRAGAAPVATDSRPARSGELREKPVHAPVRLPSDQLVGRIQFRAGGSAFVIPENADGTPGDNREPAVQIFPEDTDVALPGDRVVVRIFHGRRGKRPGERVGGVERVLERGRETLVGDLRRTGRSFFVVPDDPRFTREIHVDDPARSKLESRPAPGD